MPVPLLRHRSIAFKTGLALVVLLLVGIGALTAIAVRSATDAVEKAHFETAAQIARTEAARADGDLQTYQQLGRSIAGGMDGYTGTDREGVVQQLSGILERSPVLAGTYVAFEPGKAPGSDAAHAGEASSDDAGRFAPYPNRLAGDVALEPLTDLDAQEYYTLPKSTMADVVMEPYVYDGVMITSFISPIVRDGAFVGIGGVDVMLGDLSKEMAAVKVLDSGYAFLVSSKGLLVTAPDAKLVGTGTLDDLAAGSAAMTTVAGAASGQVQGTDPFGAGDVVISWETLPTSGWKLVTVAPTSEALAGVAELRRTLLLVGALALLLIAGITVLVLRRMLRPLGTIAAAADRLAAGERVELAPAAGDDEIGRLTTAFARIAAAEAAMTDVAVAVASGDLTREVVPRGPADVLGNALARMTGRLRDVVGELARTSGALAGASQRVAAAADASSRGVGDVADATGRQTAMLAEARDAAESARRLAEQGDASMRHSAEAMAGVEQASDEVAEAMRTLRERSGRIGEIVEAIGGIADQTNLLALNAAIEAARAGEQGRGFAVVADEVRTLAEEARSAASSIAELIGEITSTTGEAVDAATLAAERVRTTAEAVVAARAAFGEIAEGTARLSDAVVEVSSFAGSMDEGVRVVAGQIGDATTSAAELGETAADLARLAGEFRTGA